ncbi:MAG: hypothetical protein J5J06_20130 [Phycisphaerae bacterium]|nr:hypothetical protein [Phycisphaerae bacterium]
MSQGKPPIKEFRAGTIVATIWTDAAPPSGRQSASYSIRIQKRYRDDRDGQWKTTSYLRPDELPKLAVVVSRAYEFLILRESEEAGT